MRVVFDTDVMVAALESASGASHQLLLRAGRGELQPLLSTSLVLEYEAVLTRQAYLQRTGLTAEDIQAALDDMIRLCHRVSIQIRWRPAAGDPDDDHVLETALNGRADAVVTFNHRDMAKAGERFGLLILRPGELLRRLR
ncbi:MULTISPECIES: putative toxin-antitoxin system toxin component, PIN family [Nitrospirillum]|uniref:Putative toxin-antitoxin system toxin component, PIN family n=1 Tax=Nitrospirillum viridazoti CBAmc TaxID=1441467 RepID=A0A248JRP4_9PROT|nr:putative toxin-antitoxin system toxin component, PIN family [Nitrospirillum amazonense]ASG21206.1 putative toxin-antitoxin system toxin component, PIN family [Nitrospirillum amazonense CBAmc]MEC4592427.1 putative toxin-antitoxin system toxin component, PIN family [Nitrospirillum amazonense]